MAQVRWLDEPEEQAWRSLQLMELQLTARLSRELAASGSDLSYPDYVALAVLTDRPDHRMRVFELATEIGWEKSRLSHHLARMAARGLVTRERCESDRRGSFVVVTPLGRRKLAAAAPGHVAAVRRYFVDLLTEEQVDTVGEIARTVLTALAEEDETRPG